MEMVVTSTLSDTISASFDCCDTMVVYSLLIQNAVPIANPQMLMNNVFTLEPGRQSNASISSLQTS